MLLLYVATAVFLVFAVAELAVHVARAAALEIARADGLSRRQSRIMLPRWSSTPAYAGVTVAKLLTAAWIYQVESPTVAVFLVLISISAKARVKIPVHPFLRSFRRQLGRNLETLPVVGPTRRVLQALDAWEARHPDVPRAAIRASIQSA
ncbi:MAG: hypothetical protein AB1941_19165 [Gemmatimonadota bacterium]